MRKADVCNLHRFKVERYIGHGKFSTIYEVSKATNNDGELKSRSRYAFKRVYFQRLNAIRCIMRERSILVKVASARRQSPFLVKLLECFRCTNSVVFIETLASKWSLHELILSKDGLRKEADIRFYLCEIMSGLEYLHTLKIVHLDVKPMNMLLSYSGHVLIADMDGSYDLNRGEPRYVDFCGTPPYFAPEIAESRTISVKSDVWSLGITLVITRFSYDCHLDGYTIGEKPYVDVVQWSKNLKGSFWKGVSAELKDVINSCLQPNLDKRLDIGELKQLNFFSQVSWDDVESLKLQPPYIPKTERVSSSKQSDLVLNAAYSEHFPKFTDLDFVMKKNAVNGKEWLAVEPPMDFEQAGWSKEALEDCLKEFNFVSPNTDYRQIQDSH